MKTSLVLAGGTLALLTAGAPASAATFTATNLADGGPGSLRQALEDANFNPGPDVVNVAPGVNGILLLTSGSLSITDAVEVTGPGASAFQINGNGVGPVLSVASAAPVRLSGFTVAGGAGFLGGGIYNVGGELTLTDCSVLNNTAFFGGGIENDRGTLNLRGCLIAGNGSDFFGGGVDNTGTLSVVGSVFQDNDSFQGGAISSVGGVSVSLVGSVFTRNSGTGAGGAVYASSGPATVVNSTFAANAAPSGSDLFSGFGDLTVANSILWGSAAPALAGESSTISVSRSDVQGGLPLGVTDGGGNIDADPLFFDLAAGDFRLEETSPCVDGGDSALVPADYTEDLAGNNRISGSAVDMGAYEVPLELSADERILALQDRIRALAASGVRLPARGNALLATLQLSAKALRCERPHVAIAGLSAFNLQVRALVQSGRLDPQIGTELITESQSIIAQIRG